MRRPLLLIVPVAALAGALVMPSGTAWSAEASAPVTWSVSPADATGPDGRAWIEQTLDPGTIVTEHLAVRNLGEAAATFKLSAADGYITETGRFNMLQSGETSVDAGTWISVEPQVSVEAGNTAVVPFTIAIPDNATPGDHAAGIAASIVSSGTTPDGAEVGVESRVGFRVMIRVDGELEPELDVRNVTTDYVTSWNPFEPGRLVVGYEAENAGNTRLAFADRVGDVEAARGDLLPGDRRSIDVEPMEIWPLGLVTVDLTVRASVPDESAHAPEVSKAIVVWAIPWPHLLLAIGVLLVAAAAVFGRRRSRAKLERLLEQARADGRNETASQGR